VDRLQGSLERKESLPMLLCVLDLLKCNKTNVGKTNKKTNQQLHLSPYLFEFIFPLIPLVTDSLPFIPDLKGPLSL
jgi:hypothetical protein